MATKYHKCPFCTKKYVDKKGLYNHMEKFHEKELGELSAANVYFNFRNKKTHGTCIICGKPTKFNEQTEKYERVHDKVCKDKYRQQFKDRMNKKYGKTTLLDDPEMQNKMLENRRISGKYHWSSGKGLPTQYVGSYEKDFLEFLDKQMDFKSNNVLSPSNIAIPYTFANKKHFYMPDFYLPDFNLLIEIKGKNNHYQKRDELKEKKKDEVASNSQYNYLKIVDKKYNEFIELIDKLRESDGIRS